MARIRTIKPEFCTSAQLAECSRNARLLFVLMWMYCDDNGVHPANPKQLRMECFPGDDDLNAAAVQGMVDELKVHGLLIEYENAGQRYWQVTGWKHQRIDKPQPGKYPLLTDENSTNEDGARQEHSGNGTGTFPPEGKGKEGKGREGNGSVWEAPAAPAKRKRQLPDDFMLTDERTSVLLAESPTANPAAEFAQFSDHHRSRGNTMLDWDAAWRTWCRNSRKFNGGKTHGTDRSSGTPSAVDRVRAATGQ